MMTRLVRTLLCLAIVCVMAGCIWPPAKPADEPIPDWVRSLPQSKTAIYAVASWPPTFFPLALQTLFFALSSFLFSVTMFFF